MSLLRIIYSSRAIAAVADEELSAIATHAAARNAEDAITGMLLYYRSTYVQMIEGKPGVIRALYARLHLDPRHKAIRMLFEAEVAQRECPEWAMHLQAVDAVHEGRLLLRQPLPATGKDSSILAVAPSVFENRLRA